MRIEFTLILLVFSSSACAGEETPAETDLVYGVCASDDDDFGRPKHWTSESHCQGAEPDYDRLFDDTAVQTINITMSPENYQLQIDDLAEVLGQGPRSGDDPVWIPVTIEHDGLTWSNVGMRYKGNSSLSSAYNSGIRKLAFRLNFDKFEDDYPEVEDQRFYGFKKMTFSNGFNDPSLIRDKLAADIFRAGGVPAARGSFARVFVDFGEGAVYFGLYTMIEDPSNRMLDTQFEDDSGNLYKPDGDSADWTTLVEADFEKKTNEDEADFSDVQAAITALNADRADASAWRAGLEARFHVAGFLRWLAINQAMVNWDTYGWMTHNYYLYADPSLGGRLVWFPWDLNESQLIRNSPMARHSESLTLAEIGNQWPLIRFVLDDSVYYAQYLDELERARNGAFEQASVLQKMRDYHDLIAPYVTGTDGEEQPYSFLSGDSAFESALPDLESHLLDRHAALSNVLD